VLTGSQLDPSQRVIRPRIGSSASPSYTRQPRSQRSARTTKPAVRNSAFYRHARRYFFHDLGPSVDLASQPHRALDVCDTRGIEVPTRQQRKTSRPVGAAPPLAADAAECSANAHGNLTVGGGAALSYHHLTPRLLWQILKRIVRGDGHLTSLRSILEMGRDFIASPPPGRPRAIVSLVIVLYLLWQVAVPISYYLGDDANDERFSWRMFSAIAYIHRTCTATVTEIESLPGAGNTPSVRPLELRSILHPTWIVLLNRYRRPVVDKFLRTRCQNDLRPTEIEYSRSCPLAGESRIPSVTVRLTCPTGASAGSTERP
jgi:hypothetical protein